LITKDIRLLVLKFEGKYFFHLLIKRKRVCQLISKKLKIKTIKNIIKHLCGKMDQLHTQLLKEHVQNGTKFAGTTFHSKGLHFSTLIWMYYSIQLLVNENDTGIFLKHHTLVVQI
jgi:hypothetical protein